jgi:hypothetical protein
MVPGIKAVPIPAHDSIRLHVDRQFYRPLHGSQKRTPLTPSLMTLAKIEPTSKP